MIYMLTHLFILNIIMKNLIKDTVRKIGTKRSMATSKMTVSYVKNPNTIVL